MEMSYTHRTAVALEDLSDTLKDIAKELKEIKLALRSIERK